MTAPISSRGTRDLLLILHRWASLITGAFLVVIAITGCLLSFEDPRSPMRTVRTLHTHLLAGEPGEVTVTTVTVVTLVVVLIGVVLWWRDKIWRVRTGASWKRIVFDLHHLLGIAASAVLVVMLVGAVAVVLTEEEDEEGGVRTPAVEVQASSEALPGGTALALHTGAFGGTPTTIIWFTAGLVLAGQALSGFVMWWNGRKPVRR